MAGRSRRKEERREPIFDIAPAPDAESTRGAAAKGREGRRKGDGRRGNGGGERRNAAPKRRSRKGIRFRRLAYWAVVLTLWLFIAGIGVLVWVGSHLPPIQSLEVPKRPPSIQILGLDGRVLANRGDMGGAAVPLKELPPYLPKAFVAIEDRRFFFHYGIDPVGLTRAVFANLLHRGVSQGGSTITQQLAKNLFLTQERTITRKLQEVVLALWLEHKFKKTEILELYVNRVYFGSGAYGVEAAAQRYFGKSARQVTLAEAALLAGLVKSPSRLAPTRNFDAAERRAKLVLTAMADAGFIKGDAAKVAMARPPRIVKQSAGGSLNYVADWVMDVLNDVVGRVEDDVVVETAIDPTLQAAAERAVVDELAQKGDRYGVEQGALVAMTPDGAVRALVGGKSYAESQFNRAVAAKRQPGSAFKPFVYLTALEHGLTPDTVRDDKPIALKGWRPENYTHEYLGPVTLTQGLAMSLNTVSVRLTLEFGPAEVVKTAYRLGITSKLDPNPSIALGTSEVSVLELVSAYVPFANGGQSIVPHVVERVRTADGKKTLYSGTGTSFGRIVDMRYIAMMNAMMRETLLMGTARKADLPGWMAAGKTGTSQDFRDAWFIGYTGHLVTGVWLGNDDSSPTRKASGGGLPVEIWSRFMKVAHQNVASVDLPGLTRGSLLPPMAAAPMPPMNLPPANISSDRLTSADRLAPAPVAGTGNVRPQADHGLDGWLIERLFGKQR
jgi:penicillin-binding protein 1A